MMAQAMIMITSRRRQGLVCRMLGQGGPGAAPEEEQRHCVSSAKPTLELASPGELAPSAVTLLGARLDAMEKRLAELSTAQWRQLCSSRGSAPGSRQRCPGASGALRARRPLLRWALISRRCYSRAWARKKSERTGLLRMHWPDIVNRRAANFARGKEVRLGAPCRRRHSTPRSNGLGPGRHHILAGLDMTFERYRPDLGRFQPDLGRLR